MFDLSIEKLKEEENLSVRSCNVLKQNGFFFLSQILTHYQNHGTFINFRNCGLKSQEELTFICQKYKNHFVEKGIDISDSEIPEVYRPDVRFIKLKDSGTFFRLKEKTKVFLRKNGFVFVKDVCDHYERSKSFKTLPSCTQGINSELILFVKKFKVVNPVTEELPRENLLQTLDAGKYDIVEQWLFTEFNLLSLRTRNVITKYLEDQISLKSYYESCIESNVDFFELRNSGEKTVDEITNLNQRLYSQIEKIKKSETSTNSKFILFVRALSELKNLPYRELLKYESKFIDRRFPIFDVFLNLYIETLHLKSSSQLVLKYFLQKEYEGLQFKEIAEVIDLSAERIRQLKIKWLPTVLNFFEFDEVTTQTIIDHTSYLENGSDCIYLNKLRNYYFEDEIVSIQDEILYKALGNLFKHSHEIFIHEGDRGKNAFLISRNIKKHFQIEDFLQDLDQKLTVKRTDDEFLNFEGYIYKFIIDYSADSFNKIKKVCELIVEQGYELIITFDNEILFSKNSNKSLPEIIYNGLLSLGRPSHLSEIVEVINKSYPGKEFSENSIRNNIFRIPGIITFSRTSTYGLKEWEKENGIRGGTIKNIVKEFLLQYSEPKHILEIEEYVKKFRDTNERNIITNLKADPERQFVFFPSNMVGLVSKNYSSSKLKFKRLPSKAPWMFLKYLGTRKVCESELEDLTMKLFKVNIYQARYWIKQHKIKGTFARNLINFL